jgi:hypothetical protein
MWLVSLSKNDWVIAMLCSCQSEYRSDAAGVFSACREVHVHHPLSPFAPRIWNNSLAISSFVVSLLLSIFEPVSSILVSNHFHRRSRSFVRDHIASSLPDRHCSEPQDLTSRSHAVATILRNHFSYHNPSPAWSSLQLIIVNRTSGYVVESLLSTQHPTGTLPTALFAALPSCPKIISGTYCRHLRDRIPRCSVIS